MSQNLSDQKIVNALLDLISLEGIYPSLSPGVGVPTERRVKSVLQVGRVTRPSLTDDNRDEDLLGEVCNRLRLVAEGESSWLITSLQERILVDLIAGLGELAYNNSVKDEISRILYDRRLRSLLDRYVLSIRN